MSFAAENLCSLDVSGNVFLGNQVALQLLEAFKNRLFHGAGGYQLSHMSLCLAACGIESPLSKDFVRMVKLLQRKEEASMPHLSFKVDLFGNLIDKGDMSLLSS